MQREFLFDPAASAPADPAPPPPVQAAGLDPNTDDAGRRLGAELEAALVRALLRDWHTINANFFRFALKPPSFVLSDASSRLGRWSTADRTIEIGRRLVLDHPWGVVVEVLKHEVAHQYVSEGMQISDESAHGEAFRRTCAKLGIDATASGLPRAGAVLNEGESRALSRIARLLALAESSNQHEAELAMREAQRLMLKHNLAVHEAAQPRAYAFRHLGEPTGRLQMHQRVLSSILTEHFFVEAIWVTVHRPLEGTSGTVLEVCGTVANLEMAAYVHDFLLATGERLWRAHKRQQRIQSDADRRSYLVGVMRGFSDKLDAQRKTQRQEGLVWVKDADLGGYLRQRYPRQRRVESRARTSTDAFNAGKSAGREIVLHKPVERGSSSERRQLPPRR